jgi:hypothetical protein
MGSIKAQVVYCLTALQAYGESRHEARADHTAELGIYSVRTMQNYCELDVSYASWCQSEQFIERRIADLTPMATAAYIKHLRGKGRSPATVNTYACAIKKLDIGMREVGWRRRDAAALVQDYHGRRADVVADPYSPDDAERLIATLFAIDPQYGQVARLQRVSGLRVDEAVHLRADWVKADGSEITLPEDENTHAKGGRSRRIPILPRHTGTVVALREQGLDQADLHLFRNRQSLTDAVKRTASALVPRLEIEFGDGTHSLRKTYANELYEYLVNVRHLPVDLALQILTEVLGHSRIDVLKAYLSAENLK